MRKLEVLNQNREQIGLDVPIPQLNNHTLREVFEDGNSFKLESYAGGTVFENDHGEVEFTVTNLQTNIGLSHSDAVNIGDKVFIYSMFKPMYQKRYRMLFNNGYRNFYSLNPNEYNEIFGIIAQISSSTARFYFDSDTEYSIGDKVFWKELYTINLNPYGLENLSENEMKHWLDIYQYFKSALVKESNVYFSYGNDRNSIAYVNKTIDDIIPELNNHTLRQVFEDANLIKNNELKDGSLYWENSDLAYIDFTDETLKVQPDGITWADVRHDVIWEEHVYFYRFDKVSSTLVQTINSLRQPNITYTVLEGVLNPQSINLNLLDKVEVKFIVTDITINQLQLYSAQTESGLWELDNFYLIDAEKLGIENLTFEQFNYYYELYLLRRNVSKKLLTYADIFERRNIFDNPEINDNTNDYGVFYCTIAHDNGEMRVTSDKTQRITHTYQNLGVELAGHRFYTRLDFMNLKGTMDYMGFQLQMSSSPYTVDSNILINNPINGQWYEISDILSLNIDTNIRMMSRGYYSNTLDNYIHLIDNFYVIDLYYFDELITKEVLDELYAFYLLIKRFRIYPEVYLITEPVGLGTRNKMLSVNDKTYGQELNFEDISFKMNFGIHYNAYDGYNLMREFIKDNKCIIKYDWGKGSRYADARLLGAPKTEKETGSLLINKWQFKHDMPFYEPKERASDEVGSLENTSFLSVDLFITITNITDDYPQIEFEADEVGGSVEQYLKFDLSELATAPTTIYIDSENKKIYDNLGRNLYSYIDFSVSNAAAFISVDSSKAYILYPSGGSFAFNWKHWVVD